MTSRPALWWQRIAVAAGLALLAALIWPIWLQARGNFHMVQDGALYRSAQPGPGDLAHAVRNYGIRSVLNLRGAQPEDDWYRIEVSEAASLGLHHVDFPMSASRKPTAQDVDRLVALMRDMPRPILVHCRSGSDRTGFASALYLAAVTGMDKEQAEGQLSFAYGHVGIPVLSAAWPMDQGWEEVEARLVPAS